MFAPPVTKLVNVGSYIYALPNIGSQATKLG